MAVKKPERPTRRTPPSVERETPASALQFHDVEQGSADWFQARCGIPTASNFSIIMAEGRDGGPSLTRTEYLYRLAGEKITGEPAEETFKSRAMERGNAMEPLAVQDYADHSGASIKRIGFATNFEKLKHCGASPDGLIGFDGVLEIKTMRPDLMIPLLKRGASMPPGHVAQVMGNLWVLEREWCDLKIFWPKMPRFTVRVSRNETYIRELSNQVERFNHDLNTLVADLKKMGAGQ